MEKLGKEEIREGDFVRLKEKGFLVLSGVMCRHELRPEIYITRDEFFEVAGILSKEEIYIKVGPFYYPVEKRYFQKAYWMPGREEIIMPF